MANANTKELLGTITADGKYHAEPTARATSKKGATRKSSTQKSVGSSSSGQEALRTAIGIYQIYKDSKDYQREKKRREEIRKMLKKRRF